MNTDIQDLLDRLNLLSGRFESLREGIRKTLEMAELDPEMALIRARKVLEYVVRDVFERRVNEPPGTRPLENLVQRLVKDGHLPPRLEAFTESIRKLGNLGAHGFDKGISAADVYLSLDQLTKILEWYFETERPDLGVTLGRTHVTVSAGAVGEPKPAGGAREAQIAVVPKGLRSFDAGDSAFFMQLLPGPRDEHGLPESLRFWKHKIEPSDEPAFAVGVIYGPSGCGKSSLVKAGLLPRLSREVVPVYVEASPDETEARLQLGLRRRFAELASNLDLTASILALRGTFTSGSRRKALIVLDQFEQWLHGRRREEEPELARALRQCDGDRVQCILIVWDDFWVALTRFMDELRIPIVQGQNATLVDLFDLRHARKVLTALGRAYEGCLPSGSEALSREQESFVAQATDGLAQDGRVISIRLALFADMVKGKPWVPATLKQVGGAEGVGVNFLEETFASAALRPHQSAGRAILKALLPETGSEITGHSRSREELALAANYGNRPRDLAALLFVLDHDLRLITPTDRGLSETDTGEANLGDRLKPELQPGATQFYQLTHDYLVPSLREWLARKQKETRRGRAELRLAERASLWNVKPENRHLPSLLEWLEIRLLTWERDWTVPERRTMQTAARVHGLRSLGAAVGLVILVVLGSFVRRQVVGSIHARGLVEQLKSASIERVPSIVSAMSDYRQWVNPALKEALLNASGTPAELRVRLGLLPVDPAQASPIYDWLLRAGPSDAIVIRTALEPYRAELNPRLRALMDSAKAADERLLPAASALAIFEPEDMAWSASGGKVADALVRVNLGQLPAWIKALDPARAELKRPLAEIFGDSRRSEVERSTAAIVLRDYAADDAALLARLLSVADPVQFSVIYPVAERSSSGAIPVLRAELRKTPQPDWQESPLDDSWAKPEASHVRQIEAAAGSLSERSGYCLSIRLDDLMPLCQGLRGSGYRPIRLRPFADGDVIRAAAVWARDGREWQFSSGLTAPEVLERDSERPAEGFLPVDVSGYVATGPDGRRSERYAALWVKRARPDETAQVYAGVMPGDHQSVQNRLDAKRLAPTTLQAVLGADGVTRYSGVWAGPKKVWAAGWDQTESALRENIASMPDAFVTDLSPSAAEPAPAGLDRARHALEQAESDAVKPGHLDLRFAAVWSEDPLWETVAVYGLEPAAHSHRCRELEAAGYRPLSMSAARTTRGGPLVTASVWQRPLITEQARDQLAERKARAATTLLRMGSAADVWPLLQHSSDPRLRSYIINWFKPLGADPALVAGTLRVPSPSVRRGSPGTRTVAAETADGGAPGSQEFVGAGRPPVPPVARSGDFNTTNPPLTNSMDKVRFDPDTSTRRALILALGTYAPTDLAPADRESLITTLRDLYGNDPDAGIHGAAEWALRQWSEHARLEAVDGELGKLGDKNLSDHRWCLNARGHTFARIDGPIVFWMGSPRTDAEKASKVPLHKQLIRRSFSIATKEVTLAQFQEFTRDSRFKQFALPDDDIEARLLGSDSPIIGVSWFIAAAYCNWLSEKEGIDEKEWCYEPKREGGYVKGMTIPRDALQRKGYRLPTEAEWEYACRAGAVTTRYYGSTLTLLDRYAWYFRNSGNPLRVQRCGLLMCNDLGLFDMLGNVYEWCQDRVPLAADGTLSARGEVVDDGNRVLRGGAFANQAAESRSAQRFWYPPSERRHNQGFRIARTAD
jgi:formylglycine-generating enzyme required for sulfatase activity